MGSNHNSLIFIQSIKSLIVNEETRIFYTRNRAIFEAQQLEPLMGGYFRKAFGDFYRQWLEQISGALSSVLVLLAPAELSCSPKLLPAVALASTSKERWVMSIFSS